MRWKQIVLCSIVAALSFGGGMLVGRENTKEPEAITMAAPGEEENEPSLISTTPAAQTLPPLPVESSTPAIEEEQYLLMLSGEHISIYALLENGGTELVQKTEVDTAQLRREDYESLCRGVTVDSLAEARSLCEDFGN